MSTSHTPRELLIEDFDRLAALPARPVWNHNIHYYPHLLRLLPGGAARILDLGCGNGDLARLLAAQGAAVDGVDFSPGMIAAARALTPAERFPRVRYHCAEFLEAPLAEGAYDAIVSAAAVHHLELDACLRKCDRLLTSGGRLIILDLYEPTTALDMLYHIAAVPVSRVLRRRHGAPAESREEAALWEAHGHHDRYLPLRAIAAQARAIFPRVTLRRLLLWRYLLCASKA